MTRLLDLNRVSAWGLKIFLKNVPGLSLFYPSLMPALTQSQQAILMMMAGCDDDDSCTGDENNGVSSVLIHLTIYLFSRLPR